ncbi:MAG TPA: TIGR04551 family protein [Myxococcota bacterium]|nr:TIGR04551 family protein [Myxococcota bacterium]
MRSWLVTMGTAIFLLSSSAQLFAQDESKPAVENQKEDENKTVPAAKTPEQKTPELPPVGGGELTPLEPAAGDAAQSEPMPLPDGFREVTMDEAEAVKPPLNVLDLHGYLRLRGDLNAGLSLGLPERTEGGVSYPQFPHSATKRSDTLADANMRFRLEPTVNISEDVRIMAQIDILDNLILGSTPDGYPQNQYYPLVVFSQGQNPPSVGINSLRDSIAVKRVWGEVRTPLGLLRFGRMPSEWGLGLLANDGGPYHVDNGPLVTRPDPMGPVGQCFDCDYGSTADRIMFATKLFGHYVIPMIDFTSEGPYSSYKNEYNGQSIDIDQLDDVNSYILAIMKRDKPEDIRHALAQDDWVLNYGVYFVYRNQALDAADYNTAQPADPGSGALQDVGDYAVRNAEAYIPDIWVRFMWRKLRIELELVMIKGKIGYTNINHNLDADGNLISGVAEGSIDLQQFGGVLQADYTLLDDKLRLGLELGFASGDDSPGMGVRPFAEKQFSYANHDTNVNNFRFNLDYHVDMILWRQIIGTVTDAIYVKPSVQYNIVAGLGTKLSAIYSSAIYRDSTRGKASPLGLEFDLDFFYFSDDNFHAGISYGLLIPMSGMSDLGEDMAPGGIGDNNQDDDANIAHRILARLVLYF